jgi:integrase/recombinase XerC
MSDLVVATRWQNRGGRRFEAVQACERGDAQALADLLAAFLSYRGRSGSRTSASTVRTYRVAVEAWAAWCWPERSVSPRVHLLQAELDDIELWVAELLLARSHSTVATYLSGVRRLYDALVWAGAVRENPADSARAARDPTPAHEKRPALPVPYFRAALDVASGPEPRHARDVLLLHLLGSQGLRASEAAGVRLGDVDLRSLVLHVRHGKGAKARTIPLAVHTRRALEEWLPLRWARPGELRLLVNVGDSVHPRFVGRGLSTSTVRRIVNRILRSAAVPARYHGAHTLRHTTGTRVYRATRDLYRVAEILGHSSVQTSAGYAKMDDAGLREAMVLLGDDLG